MKIRFCSTKEMDANSCVPSVSIILVLRAVEIANKW